MIKPSVGRKVWYRPSKFDLLGPGAMQTACDQADTKLRAPLDATVIAVWGDRMVNLLVTDIVGKQFPVLSCTLLQDDDKPTVDAEGAVQGRYAEWMPYQVGQAKKDEAAPAA